MQNKCKALIKLGVVALIASLPITVLAQPDDLLFIADFTTDSEIPSGLRSDGQTFTTFVNDLIGAGESDPTPQGSLAGAATGSAQDANTPPMIVVLGGVVPPLDDISSPAAAIDVINSITAGLVEFRGAAMLGVIETTGILPSVPQISEDPPLLIKWYNSLLEAVGMENACRNPTGGRETECDTRTAAR